MVQRNLYVECFSGVSGDMTVADLLDLCADKEILLKGLDSLNVGGYKIKISRVSKNGINDCDFNVILDNSFENDSELSHSDRNIYDIYNIIDNSLISNKSKALSKKIFKIKAEAESKAHNISLEEVYFHEKGAVDSIIDIVGAAICLDNLNVEEVIVSQIYDGSVFVNCRRGIIPVPVPAVVNIASEYNLNMKITDINVEMVTPTGAAIMAAIRTKNAIPDNYEIIKTGIGAGKRIYQSTGVLRMFLIKDK